MPRGPREEDSRWKLAFAALAGARLLSLIPTVIDDDEAWWTAAGRAMRSPWDIYRQAVDNKPPGMEWFYWLCRHLVPARVDAQGTRLVFMAAMIGAALVLGRMAGRGNVRWRCSFFFLCATVVADPKLLSATDDGLLAILVVFAYAVFLKRAGVLGAVLSGVILGLGLLVKQTGVFFLVPPLLACRPTGWRLRALLLASAAAVALAAAWAVDYRELMYWAWEYPRATLTGARGRVFQGSECLRNGIFWAVALWPLLPAAARGVAGNRGWRDLRLLWAGAGVAALVLGRGLFLHYFILLAGPLSLLASEGWENLAVASPSKHWVGKAWTRLLLQGGPAWLLGGGLLAALIVALPGSGIFWGTDLLYYQALDQELSKLPTDRILIWGGTALPLAFRGHFVTRFPLPRFATPPYGSLRGRQLITDELERTPPDLILDLHERGDNRFALPPNSDPWLAAFLSRPGHGYRPYVAPALPWAHFYLASPPPEGSGLLPEVPGGVPFPPAREPWKAFLAPLHDRSPPQALQALPRIDLALRARESLQLLERQGSPEVRARARELDQASETSLLSEPMRLKLDELFRSAGAAPPLPWRSSALWWLEVALVQLQPRS